MTPDTRPDKDERAPRKAYFSRACALAGFAAAQALAAGRLSTALPSASSRSKRAFRRLRRGS